MNIVNCYNKNNDYHIDFRQLLEEDEFAEYEEKLRSRNISFTDIAKEPSSVNEIISRTVHNYVINPDELKYIILDKTVILDVSSDSLIKLKNAIKEYARHFKNMIIIEIKLFLAYLASKRKMQLSFCKFVLKILKMPLAK